MGDESFYRKFGGKSVSISSRWKEALDQPWGVYYGFEVTPISPDIWREEEILCSLDKEFGFTLVGLQKMPPYFNYNWHVDVTRGCGLNMLLSDGESHTFFAKPSRDDHRLMLGSNSSITQLKYEPDSFYAFNTRKLHCVYNLEKPRYIFTCEFSRENGELSYERLSKWIDATFQWKDHGD